MCTLYLSLYSICHNMDIEYLDRVAHTSIKFKCQLKVN
jgi:hypothetical protein